MGKRELIMKINKNLFIVSALMAATLSAAATTPEEYYQQGCDFYAKGNMVEARKAFEASAMGGNAMSQVCFANFLKQEGKLKDAIKWYEKAAMQNDHMGQYFLGEAYFNGIKDAIPQDHKKAADLFAKSAAQKNPFAQYYLAKCYFNGFGVSEDKNKALELIKTSAAANYATAMTELGILYTKGLLVPKDYEKAFELFQKPAAGNYSEAQFQLGCLFFSGLGVDKNLEKTAYWWLKAAEQGHFNAMNEIGICYLNGWGVKKDVKTAIMWFEKAVAEKHPIAMRALGNIYSQQEEFRDFKKAVKYYQMAVDHGNVESIYELANCYFHGAGVTQDKSKGVELLHRAAEKNFAVAQYILGTLYEKGDGVPKDAKKAVEWYSRAADNGHLPAFFPLAAAYFGGKGVEKDLKKGAELVRYAAGQNDADSQYVLNAYKIITAPKELNNVKFVYTPTVCENNGLEKMPKMEFIKDGKLILSIEAKVQNLCFVEEVWADKKNNKMRLTFTPYNFEGKDFDWRTKLLDLKGDGDYRYLIIADYHTGTADGDRKGYVIDVKDNFKHIATIPVGEAFDLPYHNPKLIFDGEK